MKILQITNSFFPVIGGQEKVVLELSKGLSKRGHDVTVLTTDYLCNDGMKNNKKFNFDVVRFKNKYWLAGYGYSKDAMDWLKNNYSKFDIIHCHGYNRYLPEFSLRFLRNKKPTVFSPQGFVHTEKNWVFKKLHDLTVGKFIRHATYVTALTKEEVNYYSKFGINKNKIYEVPGGVDLTKFSKNNNNKLKLFRKKYNLQGDFILSVGRIHESKGFQYAIKAIKNTNLKLAIVGKDVGFKKELEKIIYEESLHDKVKILEGLSDDELVSAYNSCFAFVLFSEWEGFGIVVIEAMAAGKPIIVSNRGSLPYLVKDRKNGLIARFPSIEDLTQKMKEIEQNKNLRLKLSKESKKFSSSYSWDNVVKMTEKIYKSALKNER